MAFTKARFSALETTTNGEKREEGGKGRETGKGKGREGKGREGKGREGKREMKGREITLRGRPSWCSADEIPLLHCDLFGPPDLLSVSTTNLIYFYEKRWKKRKKRDDEVRGE